MMTSDSRSMAFRLTAAILAASISGLSALAQTNMQIKVFVTVVAIVIGFQLPTSAEDRPSDPFGNHTIEVNKDGLLFTIWDPLRDQVLLERPRFPSCIESPKTACPEVSTLLKVVEEARQYKGKALLGHLNRSINRLAIGPVR